ncbi:MAG: carboxypeptidase regulatory-like domain-containing protein [Acidobacteria bacterium]|nr:carboxypeptidase regulatory-like domain-containing protein [Acidobacteriota bacterium]
MRVAFHRFAAAVLFASVATAQSGGPYQVEKLTISSGGGTQGGGNFVVQGTAGQPGVGQRAYGGSYGFSGGFWANLIAPTSASVRISGRVRSADGSGISNVSVTLSDLGGTTLRTASSSFGYFSFEGVSAGEAYVITVASRKFNFVESSRVVVANEDLTDIDFTAEPEL